MLAAIVQRAAPLGSNDQVTVSKGAGVTPGMDCSMPNRFQTVTQLVRWLPSRHPALVIASSGRSGSTLLQEAMALAMSRARFGRGSRYTKDEAWDLAATALRPGIVYKTHDFPDALKDRKDVRSVFVFGSATDNVRSILNQEQLKGRGWIEAHLRHLRSTGSFENLLQQDVLGIRDQVRSWSTCESSPILCVRYEALWDVQAEIRQFTGLPIELPDRRERSAARLSDATLRQVEAFYGPLDEQIARLPDVYRPSKALAAMLC